MAHRRNFVAAALVLALSTAVVADDRAGELSRQADHVWLANFRPVISFKLFDQDHTLRITLPYVLDARGEKGLAYVALLDVVPISYACGRMRFDGVGGSSSISHCWCRQNSRLSGKVET